MVASDNWAARNPDYKRKYERLYKRRRKEGFKNFFVKKDGSLGLGYTLPAVAGMLGVTEKTLRTWRKQGWIPEENSFDTRRMYFTPKQVKKLRAFKKTLDKVRAEHRYTAVYESTLRLHVSRLHRNWHD